MDYKYRISVHCVGDANNVFVGREDAASEDEVLEGYGIDVDDISTGELCNTEAEVTDAEARDADGYTACVRVSGDTEVDVVTHEPIPEGASFDDIYGMSAETEKAVDDALSAIDVGGLEDVDMYINSVSRLYSFNELSDKAKKEAVDDEFDYLCKVSDKAYTGEEIITRLSVKDKVFLEDGYNVPSFYVKEVVA